MKIWNMIVYSFVEALSPLHSERFALEPGIATVFESRTKAYLIFGFAQTPTKCDCFFFKITRIMSLMCTQYEKFH